MNLLSNPIVFCASIALGIIFILIMVVVICCKKSSSREREELKALSEEIEADLNETIVEDVEEQKIENVLSKMQEALDMKEEVSVSFEQEQEEHAIISYQELLESFGAKSSIDVDSIELFDDELESIEISDFNKEIIEAYQKEDLDREIYRFQNDYSNELLSTEIVEESPIMNFDFSDNNIEFIEEEYKPSHEVFEAKNVVQNIPNKFKRTEIISPIYGVIKETSKIDDEIEEIVFDDDSLLDEF